MIKKSSKMKDLLFYVSCTPYIIFFILGFIRCITNTIKYKYLDLFSFVEPVLDFNLSFGLISVFILIIPLCYIVFYVIDKYKYNNKEKNKGNRINKSNILLIVYFISFIPYLYLLYSCIFGINFGFTLESNTYYGFSAIIIAFILGCIILVYPIIIAFQVMYTKKNYKFFSERIKFLVKFIIGLLILSLIVFSLVSYIFY